MEGEWGEGVENQLEARIEREPLLENQSVGWVDKSKRESHRRSLRDFCKNLRWTVENHTFQRCMLAPPLQPPRLKCTRFLLGNPELFLFNRLRFPKGFRFVNCSAWLECLPAPVHKGKCAPFRASFRGRPSPPRVAAAAAAINKCVAAGC